MKSEFLVVSVAETLQEKVTWEKKKSLLKEFWDQESSWYYDWFQNFRQNTGEW